MFTDRHTALTWLDCQNRKLPNENHLFVSVNRKTSYLLLIPSGNNFQIHNILEDHKKRMPFDFNKDHGLEWRGRHSNKQTTFHFFTSHLLLLFLLLHLSFFFETLHFFSLLFPSPSFGYDDSFAHIV